MAPSQFHYTFDDEEEVVDLTDSDFELLDYGEIQANPLTLCCC